MNLLRLTKEVVVAGRDFFGRMAKIKFSPFSLPGWYWKCGCEIVPTTSAIASYNPRRITLQYKQYRIKTYEHIGALRWTGLDGIVIESSELPPYHGRVKELWDSLKPFSIETGDKVPWIRPKKLSIESMLDGDLRSVSLSPLENKMIIQVVVDFKGVGRLERTYQLPMFLEEVFGAYTLGWPSRLFYFSKLVGLFGWPHHKRIEWARTNTKEGLLNKISLHRTADLLGALSLVTHDHLVSGKVLSYKGGHKIDLGMIKKIELD